MKQAPWSLRACLRGSLYEGRVYAGVTAGLAARLATGLTAGGTVGAAGAADLTGTLRPVLIVLVFWLAELLALYCLARALI